MRSFKLCIVFITYEFPPHNATGGIGSYFFHQAKLLGILGHNVHVFSASTLPVNIAFIENENYSNHIVVAKNMNDFRFEVLKSFSQFCKNTSVDIIESAEVGACALEVKKKYPQIPLVVKLHSPGVLITKVGNTYVPFLNKIRFVAGAFLRGKIDLGYWSWFDKNKERDVEYQLCQLADSILSPSNALKKWIVKFWKIPPETIKILPNTFSFNKNILLAPIEDRPPIITFVGKLSVLKGMIAFTKAIPLILERNPSYKINIVGRDEIENGISMKLFMQAHLKRYANSLFFTGALTSEELEKIYAQTQIFVLPSLWENYPTVLLEAFAAGCSVVASNRGGIPEIIVNNENGILFNPTNFKELANKVNFLIENKHQRLKFAQSGQAFINNYFGNNKLVNKLLEIYHDTISNF